MTQLTDISTRIESLSDNLQKCLPMSSQDMVAFKLHHGTDIFEHIMRVEFGDDDYQRLSTRDANQTHDYFCCWIQANWQWLVSDGLIEFDSDLSVNHYKIAVWIRDPVIHSTEGYSMSVEHHYLRHIAEILTRLRCSDFSEIEKLCVGFSVSNIFQLISYLHRAYVDHNDFITAYTYSKWLQIHSAMLVRSGLVTASGFHPRLHSGDSYNKLVRQDIFPI